MKPLCGFHDPCQDGFAAAWCVRYALGAKNVEFYPGIYGKPPPDVTGRDVILVDFSYKRPVLEKMMESARSILILDHHESAMEDLAGLAAPPSWEAWQTIKGDEHPSLRIAALFDMNRSGAGLAWDYFNSHDTWGGILRSEAAGSRPAFIDYIEDRDLWRKKKPYGDEFTIALRSHPQDFDLWSTFVADPSKLLIEGEPLLRFFRQRVEEFKRSAYPALLAGHEIMIANVPKFASSEVAGEIAEGRPFGATYFEVRAGEWEYSLRMREGGVNVKEVALLFGGGGHPKASGFTVHQPVHTLL